MVDPVREFITRALALTGGVVEESASGFDALLPAAAAQRFGVPEEVRVGLSATAASTSDTDSGAVDGRIGSAFLERLVADRLERPVIAAVAFPAQRAASLPDDCPGLLNAVRSGFVERHRTIRRYLHVEVRATLHGQDLRSALVPLAIRLEDGARTEPFRLGRGTRVTAAPLDAGERGNVASALRSWLWRQGPEVHAVAVESLRQRGRRDLERMAEYYASLDAEMAKAVQRARAEGERARRMAKWAGLPRDVESRREQLRTRIRPRLAARIVAATLVETSVEQFTIGVRRRKREGRVAVSVRLADGLREGPSCASCSMVTLQFYLCDEQLHVLCAACGQAGVLDAARCLACRGVAPEAPVVRLEDPTAELELGPRIG